MRGAAAFLLMALAFFAQPVGAAPESRYAPVPREIDAFIVDENDRALAKSALDALEQRARGSQDVARSQLVLLEAAGLQAVARRLARADIPAHALPDLLHVVAASAHRDADILLERAAQEPRPLLRMIAADGLGRGRTPRAVPVLETLARDPLPAVRIAALRSLFSIDTPQARAARAAVPPDDEAALLTARLRWHHRAEDAWPALRDIAVRSYTRGRTAALRMAAAELLTLPRIEAPVETLLDIVQEMGTHELGAKLVRIARGVPRAPYDAVEMRRVAIETALTLLQRKDVPAADRKRLIARAVWWVARPVEMNPFGREAIPEHRLRRRLPDLGAEIRDPVVRLLREGRFFDPRAGALLLREIGDDDALPVLRALAEPSPAQPLDSRMDRRRRNAIRVAAVGAIKDIGRIEDEQLALALIFGDESYAMKADALDALTHDPGAWVVPLLGEALGNREFRSNALDVLEKRSEPEARALRVKDLFLCHEPPHRRMGDLVRKGDEAAFALLRRALSDPRPILRIAALDQFNRLRNPRLCGKAGQALLAEHTPDLQNAQEVQGYIAALLSVEPMAAVTYVRETWSRFKSNSDRMTTLRMLHETRGKAARRAAIDFALTHDGPTAPPQMLHSVGAVLMGYWSYRTDEVTTFWKRMFENPISRWEAVRALAYRGAPDMSARLLPLLARALERKAVAEDETDNATEQAFAEAILKALRYQPWTKVEAAVVGVALNTFAPSGTRVEAAKLLLGRLSDDVRARLLAWLRETTIENSAVQLHVAAAVGQDASPAQAAELYALLKQTILSFYTPERLARLEQDSFESVDADAPEHRAIALARAVAQTYHEPTIVGLLDLLLDVRFARYARIAVDRERALHALANSDAAGLTPTSVVDAAHGERGAYFGMPNMLYYGVMGQVKVLDDESLAAAIERVLETAGREGRLAHFPNLYLYRMWAALRETSTGAKPKAAEVVYRRLRRLERVDGALDYFVEAHRVTELSMGGHFEEAVEAQKRAVRILARRGHGDHDPALWRLQRARLDALRGGLYASRGRPEAARASYRRAMLRAPNDPNVLNTVAWQRALANFDLQQAEADARRATRLEARIENKPTLNAADTLAYVLLKLERPEEALDVMEPYPRPTIEDGLILYHIAQMSAAAGYLADAWDALVGALTWDRSLAAQLPDDPYFKAFRKDNLMEKLHAAATARRRAEGLE